MLSEYISVFSMSCKNVVGSRLVGSASKLCPLSVGSILVHSSVGVEEKICGYRSVKN